jgi:hypothetical protein
MYNFSRDIDLINLTRVRPHKSFMEEQMLGKHALGIIEAFDNGTANTFNVSFLEYHDSILNKDEIIDKYPEFCI